MCLERRGLTVHDDTCFCRDFIDILGLIFPEQPFGVVVDILPGLTSEYESYAFDDVGTILGNAANSNPGTDDRRAWPHLAGKMGFRRRAARVIATPCLDV